MKPSRTFGEGKDARRADIAEYLASAILSGQRSLAGRLNKRISGTAETNKRKLLILFCLIMVTMNLLILIQSLT